MGYKIVCSDLDGTLLNNDSKISQENLEAIEELIEKGIFFVPSTGRTFSELPGEIKNNQSIRYMIYANGAVVFDRYKNQRHVTGMTNEVVNQILDLLSEYEVHISIRYQGNCCVDKEYANQEAYDYYNVCEAHQTVIRAFSIYHDNFLEFCRKADEAEVFSIFFHDYGELMECREKIEQLGGLRVTGVSEYNLEIMNVEAGKGNALHWLADVSGIAGEDTISMGDSDNDISIIEAAGLGLAVSNACDSLKEVADEIICSNEEHVVPYVLSHYFE